MKTSNRCGRVFHSQLRSVAVWRIPLSGPRRYRCKGAAHARGRAGACDLAKRWSPTALRASYQRTISITTNRALFYDYGTSRTRRRTVSLPHLRSNEAQTIAAMDGLDEAKTVSQ